MMVFFIVSSWFYESRQKTMKKANFENHKMTEKNHILLELDQQKLPTTNFCQKSTNFQLCMMYHKYDEVCS